MSMRTGIRAFAVLATAFCSLARADFQLQEATIDDVHQAIRSGEMTCKQIVEAYIARAKTYNVAACSKLVTADGAKVPKLLGASRTGTPVKFPTESVAISKIVPDFDKYTGFKPDFGRMETTMSDPSVYQQYGMVVGIPHAGQVNALEVLNLRGERSVTCKG